MTSFRSTLTPTQGLDETTVEEPGGAVPLDPEPTLAVPKSLAQLLADYEAGLDEHERASQDRQLITDALLNAQEQMREITASLPGLREAWEDAVLDPIQAPKAKAALDNAKAELLTLRDLISVLDAKARRLPLDDFASSSRIASSRDAILDFVSIEELRAFPPEALTILQQAYAVSAAGMSWGDWLAHALPQLPAASVGEVRLAVLARHKVSLR